MNIKDCFENAKNTPISGLTNALKAKQTNDPVSAMLTALTIERINRQKSQIMTLMNVLHTYIPDDEIVVSILMASGFTENELVSDYGYNLDTIRQYINK